MILRTSIFPTALLCACLAPAASAQCELDKVTDNAPAPMQGFGAALALHADHAVIGVTEDESQCVGCDTGAIVFYERSALGWIQGQRLTPPSVVPGDRFGARVALHGDTAIAATDGLAAGFWNEQVFVYERSSGSWSQVQELTIPVVNAGSGFGHGVLVQDSTIFVSQPWAQIGQSTSNGVVNVYERSGGTWSLAQELTCPATAIDHANHFGKSMAIDGNRAIVGMPEFSNFELGTAYTYERGQLGWVQTGPRLGASDSAQDDHFGERVAISGTTALIWSPGKSDIYVFEFAPGAWIETGKLQTLDGAVFDDITLDYSGELALVGIAGDAGAMGGGNVGATYIFERVGGVFTQTGKFYASDASTDARFGAALDLSDGTALIAAPGDGGDVGAAYAFAFERLRNYCTSSVNSTGGAALMGYTGSASVLADDLVLTAAPVPADEPGLFYYGSRELGAPFGIGTRCVGGVAGTVFRFPFVVSTAAGEFLLPINYALPPAVSGHPGALEAGVTRKFQIWFRDPLGLHPGYNLSDGLSVTFCP